MVTQLINHAKSPCRAALVGFFPFCIALVSMPYGSEAAEWTNEQVVAAFSKTHEGYSVDEVLLQDERRNRFVNEIMGDRPKTDRTASEKQALLRLLKLRKSGKLPIRSTRRGEPVEAKWMPIAEIAARVVTDRHRISTDSILVDPKLRAELQSEAEKISPGADAYQIRKATLGLRKRRALRPELVLRVADWKREIRTLSLEQLKQALKSDTVERQPGIYLFRHASEGYLYVGEASNLSARLRQHVEASDRKALADFLAGEDSGNVTVEMHVFPSDSPAKSTMVRRAYESELIRSRTPKFNVRP